MLRKNKNLLKVQPFTTPMLIKDYVVSLTLVLLFNYFHNIVFKSVYNHSASAAAQRGDHWNPIAIQFFEEMVCAGLYSDLSLVFRSTSIPYEAL